MVAQRKRTGAVQMPRSASALSPYFFLPGLIVSTVVVFGLLLASLTGMNSPVLASRPILWDLAAAMSSPPLPAKGWQYYMLVSTATHSHMGPLPAQTWPVHNVGTSCAQAWGIVWKPCGQCNFFGPIETGERAVHASGLARSVRDTGSRPVDKK